MTILTGRIVPGLSGVSNTMLWALHNRATEASRQDSILQDPGSMPPNNTRARARGAMRRKPIQLPPICRHYGHCRRHQLLRVTPAISRPDTYRRSRIHKLAEGLADCLGLS
jgi:hypothetical protein